MGLSLNWRRTGWSLCLATLAAAGSTVRGELPTTSQRGAGYDFGACGQAFEGPSKVGPIRSQYVPMRDGVRLALDVVLPQSLPAGRKLPTVLIMTRYWRSTLGSEPSEVVKFYVSHGYAVVNGDDRGTGASFGIWRHHRSREETWDFSDVMDWVVRQPWSDGRIAGWGTSYRANTVDWMVERNHPAFKAALSLWPDYDPYLHVYFPGGLRHANMGETWGLWVKALDLNRNTRPAPGTDPHIRPVDEDPDGRMLEMAIAQRRDVPDVWQSLKTITFRDDRPAAWAGSSMDDFGIHAWAKVVERSGTPIQSMGGWMDAGTADGVLRRFMTLSNPQQAFVGPWSHAGNHDVSPYMPVDAAPTPDHRHQFLENLCYLDRVLGRGASGPPKLLHYYTMGEERWKATIVWPLPQTQVIRWNFQPEHGLSPSPSPAGNGADRYKVDFDVGTGTHNRWWSQVETGDVYYPDRAEIDRRLLTYTSEPLSADVEVTGYPVVSLKVRSTHSDGAFFAYLEDVAPDGRVIHITEGELRALHRKVSSDPPPYRMIGPYHSFKAKDAMPLVPGELADISFELLPTSVLIRKGHRIRVAIAGADKDSFTRVPDTGDPVIEVERNAADSSFIDLPVIPRR